jgi:hypothetical protein
MRRAARGRGQTTTAGADQRFEVARRHLAGEHSEARVRTATIAAPRQGRGPVFAKKFLPTAAFRDARGWSRTTDLSRVKRRTAGSVGGFLHGMS